MSAAATLVVEILTEELPPKTLKQLGSAFADAVWKGLGSRGLLAEGAFATGYATPRRLAVAITQVRAVASDVEVINKLMPAKVATGTPDALRKKLDGLGRGHLATLTLDASDGADRVYVESDGKMDYVYLRSLAKGQSLEHGLEAALDEAIVGLPIAKVMSYAREGSYYNDVRFVRPAHRLLALHGTSVVAVRALGLRANRVTRGHRFLSHGDLIIRDADAYASTLEQEGKVVPSFAARRSRIVQGLEAAAGDATLMTPEALLDEVTALVEWPTVYSGTFDAAFLEVPQECLILTMQVNQKYFALADDSDALVNRFLLVGNIETSDPQGIVTGNERVLRARLADAKFFYDQDRRQRLDARVDRLRGVVFHNKLGTLADRIERIRFLASRIAALVGADVAQADRAALLAKADLVTDMVGEFPELQGLMGRYYAQHDGEAPAVAAAIEQHYWPRFAGDALPDDPVAQSVALADKLETLAAMFGIGQVPTGDKDPFGLRRAVLGVLRILIERGQRIGVSSLVDLAFAAFATTPAVTPKHDALLDFLYERLRGYLREQDYSVNQIAAVLDARPDMIDELPSRLAAVQAFAAMPEAAALSAANKRIVNILRKSGDEAAVTVDRSRLENGAERDLFAMFETLGPQVERNYGVGDFAGALRALASAKPVVDRYFDDVMVMADDPAVRANRLALLRGVAATMNRVADISKLVQ